MFATALRKSRSAGSANRKTLAIFVGRADLKAWLRDVLNKLLVAEPEHNDPTAHFCHQAWADLPHHHANAPE